MNKILLHLKNDLLLLICLLLVLFCFIFGKVSFTFIDWKVISTLYLLLLIILNMEQQKFLEYLSLKIIKKIKHSKTLILSFSLISFFSAMLVTNDVGIITTLPLFLMVCQKFQEPKLTIFGTCLIIISANLGSSFSPIGNPQNIFLVSKFNINFLDFISLSWLLTLLSLSVLLLIVIFIKNKILKPQFETNLTFTKKQQRKSIYLLLTLSLLILALCKVFSFWVVAPILLMLLIILKPSNLYKINWNLLITFICFFIISHNILNIHILITWIHVQTNSVSKLFLYVFTSSQFISNVPATILYSQLSSDLKTLYLSASLGGLGTLLASLANLIGYNIFKYYYPSLKTQFLQIFTKLNILIFLTLTLLLYLFKQFN